MYIQLVASPGKFIPRSREGPDQFYSFVEFVWSAPAQTLASVLISLVPKGLKPIHQPGSKRWPRGTRLETAQGQRLLVGIAKVGLFLGNRHILDIILPQVGGINTVLCRSVAVI